MSKYENDLQKIKQNLLGVKEHVVRSKARLLICVLESTNISLGCDQAGIQGRTFYNHIKVLRENGYCLHALKGKSRRLHNSPNKTSPEVESKILELRAVTLIDDCSRNVFFHVCEEKSAYEARHALHEYVNRYGKPTLIQRDNGLEFRNPYTRVECKKAKAKQGWIV